MFFFKMDSYLANKETGFLLDSDVDVRPTFLDVTGQVFQCKPNYFLKCVLCIY